MFLHKILRKSKVVFEAKILLIITFDSFVSGIDSFATFSITKGLAVQAWEKGLCQSL